jgi:tetratricopeptide (TPR) repeat protein
LRRRKSEAIRKGRELYPQDTELLLREGLLFQEQGRYRQAARSYQAALSAQEPPHFSSLEIGLNGFKTRFNLARVYGLMGNLDAEESEWRKVVAEAPTWRDGWRALLDHLLGRAGGVSPLFGRAEQVTGDRIQGTGVPVGTAVPGVPPTAVPGVPAVAAESTPTRSASKEAPSRDFAAEVEQMANALLAEPRVCGQGYLSLARLALLYFPKSLP